MLKLAAPVLLAEDDALVAMNLIDGLEEAGFQVTHVFNGVEAIARVDSTIKALITDIRMGDGPDGWLVAQKVRESFPEMPVIYVSGDSESRWAAHGVPNSVMLAKPFAISRLTMAVARMLNRQTSG